MSVYVVGHKNPDTDSVVSAIVFAYIFSKLGEEYVPSVSGSLNKETEFVLKKFGLEEPILIPSGEKKVLLVDHNSAEEGPDDLKPEEIIGIFDHHKLGGPFSKDLVPVRIEKVGTTVTIAYKVFKERDIEIPEKIAGAMLATIISDTLNFASPTATDDDRIVAEALSKISGIDINTLADEMFRAKSDISDLSTEELVGKDYKIFDMSGNRVGIGVWETVLPETIMERKDEIIALLNKKRVDDELDYAYFVAVDIIKNESCLFVASEKEGQIVEAAFGGVLDGQTMSLPGVVSRKKQMTPPLDQYFSQK